MQKLALFVMSSTVLAVCTDPQTITNHETRYVTETRCATLLGCIFDNLVAKDDSAAVSCTASTQNVSVAGSSFLSCKITGSGHFVEARPLRRFGCTISRFCVSECLAMGYANGFYFSGCGGGTFSVFEVVDARPLDSGSSVGSIMTVPADSMNLTRCYISSSSGFSCFSSSINSVQQVVLTF
jgi:hypothetical protein